MSALITIKGRLRKDDEKGKNFCRRLRLKGEVPANLMDKTKSTPIAIEGNCFLQRGKMERRFN